jgi:hypothetical protein
LQKRHQLGVLFAVLASASTWFYFQSILKPQQVADAAAHQRPRGNLSDLYPRWLGARELLLHRRNPYTEEITREIQQGYYGRPLDPARRDDPKDQQGFTYPAYIVFLLAPTVRLPFEEVRLGFRWLLIALSAGGVLLWLRVLRWKPPCSVTFVLVVLMVGWLPAVQGIKLQQLSLLVAGLLAACCACLTAGWLFLAGGLLALTTIKPQLTWPLVLWLSLWAVSEWRSRWRFFLGFAIMMALLLAGAELILPGWLRMFIAAIGQYHGYTQNQSVLVWMFGGIFGRIFEAAAVLACGMYIWRVRHEPANSPLFGRATGLVLALTVVIVPMFAPYNQVLLAPAVLALVWRATAPEPILPAIRLAGIVGAVMLLWPWIATLALSASYLWLTPGLRQRAWPMPFYSNFMIPIFVFGLALLQGWTDPALRLRDGAAAE